MFSHFSIRVALLLVRCTRSGGSKHPTIKLHGEEAREPTTSGTGRGGRDLLQLLAGGAADQSSEETDLELFGAEEADDGAQPLSHGPQPTAHH